MVGTLDVSAVAGLLWDQPGAASTFHAGACFEQAAETPAAAGFQPPVIAAMEGCVGEASAQAIDSP
jgi:hypothetical protein